MINMWMNYIVWCFSSVLNNWNALSNFGCHVVKEDMVMDEPDSGADRNWARNKYREIGTLY